MPLPFRKNGRDDQEGAEKIGAHAAHAAQLARRAANDAGDADEAFADRSPLLEPEAPLDMTPSLADVVYLDASSLAKPQRPTTAARAVMAILFVIAAVVGGLFLARFIDTVYHAAAREETAVQANITRGVSLDLPNVAGYISYDDASLVQAFTDLGYGVYVASSPAEDPSDNLDLFKLPSDVSLAEGEALYAPGIPNLSAADASLLLNGSWRFTTSRGSQTSMQVRYVDFTAGNLEAAVGAAMASQGYDEAWVASSGVDESGNLLREGTLSLADGRTASWRVAAIELEHVYDIAGIPDSAVYVGIRVTV